MLKERGIAKPVTIIVAVIVTGIVVGSATYLIVPKGAEEEEKPGEGLTFALIANGSAGQSFWDVVHKGATDAADMVGVDIVMRFYEETPDLAVEVMDEVIAAGYDGILVSDIFADLLRPKINAATAAGIPVMTILVDDPESDRISFIGYGVGFYDHGVIIANRIAPKVNNGDSVLMVAEAIAFWSEGRMDGFQETLEDLKTGLTFDVLEAGNEASQIELRLKSYLAANPDVDVIYGVGTVTSDMAAPVVEDLGYEPGEIVLGINDISPGVIDGLKKGYIEATFLGDQYMISYLAVLQMFNHVKYLFGPFDTVCGYTIIDSTNIDIIEPQVEAGMF